MSGSNGVNPPVMLPRLTCAGMCADLDGTDAEPLHI